MYCSTLSFNVIFKPQKLNNIWDVSGDPERSGLQLINIYTKQGISFFK